MTKLEDIIEATKEYPEAMAGYIRGALYIQLLDYAEECNNKHKGFSYVEGVREAARWILRES